MLNIDNRTRVLRVFFNNPLPEGGFQLREIGRLCKIALPSVKNYLLEMEREGVIARKKQRNTGYPAYFANRGSEYFLFLKKLDNIKRIEESGLVKFIAEKCTPDVIILFGSASRGEDLEGSDVDLFVLCKEKKFNLSSFEKQLNRKINVFYTNNFGKLSDELKNNLLNGVMLRGHLQVY